MVVNSSDKGEASSKKFKCGAQCLTANKWFGWSIPKGFSSFLLESAHDLNIFWNLHVLLDVIHGVMERIVGLESEL